MSQTSYTVKADEAFAGLLGDTNLLDAASRANEEATDMEFGIGVKKGSSSAEMLLMTAGATLLGVTMHRHQEDRSLSGSDGILADGGNAEVIRKGSVWVNIDQDVVEDGPVFVRVAGGNPGYFRADVDGGNAEAVPGVRFEKDALAATGIALLDVNLPA